MPETGRSQATNLKTQKQTKWIEMHQSQVKMCFLRGPLDDWWNWKTQNSFEVCKNTQRDTNYLAISRDFFGYSKLIFLFFVLYYFMLPGNFYYGSEFQHGILWGINFWSSDFFFQGFFWVLIFAPTRSSLSLEIRSIPSGLQLSWKGRWTFHTLHPKLVYIFLTGNCLGKSNEKTKPSYTVKCI